MSPRTAVRRVSGVLATVALAAAALMWAPSAAVAASSPGCAYYNGLTVTAASLTTNQHDFYAGEVINITVPAAYGLTYTTGMTFGWANVSTNTFTIPSTGKYNLSWYTEPTKVVTWKFTCGTGGTTTPPPPVSTADADRDGVYDSADRCASTTLPDRFSKPVAGRYGANSAGKFVDGKGAVSSYTVVTTKGCSGSQIVAALKLKGTDARSGITLSTLQTWAARP